MRPHRLFVGLLLLVANAPAAPALAQAPHTFDGRHDITNIDVTVAYLVPDDRTPLPDWRGRVDYFMSRIEAFHRRELDGLSILRTHVHPEPIRPGKRKRV